jgi:hypothetical protein
VFDSIPRTKGIHLDDALLRVTRPVQWVAEYPLRQSLGRDGGRQDDEVPQPGTSETRTTRNKAAESGGGLDACGSREKKGTVTPHHSQRAMKYGEKNLPKIIKKFLTYNLPVHISTENMCLLSGSLAQSTWKRYGAALKTWKKFACERGKIWKEITERERGNFIGWCKGRGKLKANTVRIYLGALECLAEMKNQLAKGGKLLEKGLLKGYANLSPHDVSEAETTTIPVDLKILSDIKEGIG